MVKLCINNKYTIITITIALLGGIYSYLDPSKYIIMPKCPVKLLTTLDCPGCGFQRALYATFHGNFKEAISYNLFLLVAIPIICFWCLNGIFIENIANYHINCLLIRVNRWIIYFYIVSYLLWFVIRNV